MLRLCTFGLLAVLGTVGISSANSQSASAPPGSTAAVTQYAPDAVVVVAEDSAQAVVNQSDQVAAHFVNAPNQLAVTLKTPVLNDTGFTIINSSEVSSAGTAVNTAQALVNLNLNAGADSIFVS